MSGRRSRLDAAALAELRRLSQALADGTASPTRLAGLVAEAGARLPDGEGIDVEATRELGDGVVVVRFGRPTGPDALPALSQRERVVAGFVAAGLSNKQIARRLATTLATVKYVVHGILGKGRLSNRAALAAAWSRRGDGDQRESPPNSA